MVLEPQDLQVRLVPLVKLDKRAQLDLQVRLVLRVLQEVPDLLDLLDQREVLALQGQLDPPAKLVLQV